MFRLFWFEIALDVVVLAYALILVFKMGMPLYRYHSAKHRVVRVDGVIDSFYGEEMVGQKRSAAPSFYPVYRCEIGGKNRFLNGSVRYFGKGSEYVGQWVQLIYDKENDELWCEEDIPKMKKQMRLRLALMGILMVVMVLSSVLL